MVRLRPCYLNQQCADANIHRHEWRFDDSYRVISRARTALNFLTRATAVRSKV